MRPQKFVPRPWVVSCDGDALMVGRRVSTGRIKPSKAKVKYSKVSRKERRKTRTRVVYISCSAVAPIPAQ
jgi:hypothetical protein